MPRLREAGSIMEHMMTHIFKLISVFGMLGSIAWFAMEPDFAAVLLGILSLAVFMMTFLPVRSDEQI